MTTSAVARLVGDRTWFLRDTFGREPLYVPARIGDSFADVLSLDDVDRIVASSGLRAPSFRLVRSGATLPMSQLTRDARIGSRPVNDLADVGAVHAAFGDGATVVLQGLHRSWEPVTALCRALEDELTHPVQANAYLTPPVAQGLNLHEDAHDVFAVQTYGEKRWVVEPPDGSEPWDLTMRPGDVLYLPAGTRHAAQTVDQPSLHLTLGIRTVRWSDAVDRAVRSAVRRVASDQPLPAGWAGDPKGHRDTLAAQLEALATAIRDDAADIAADALAAMADDHHGRRIPDRRGGLRDLLEVDHLDDATQLSRRPGSAARPLDAADGRVTLVLSDRRVVMPAELQPVLERIMELETFRPADLDDLVDGSSRLVLCRRLVREGWLRIDRGDARPAAGAARA